MDLLDQILNEALAQQARRRNQVSRRARKTSSPATDYATRLSEKALYRRLINESNIAQDGLRFIFFFGQPAHAEGRSLDEWRKKIDKEMEAAKQRAVTAAEAG